MRGRRERERESERERKEDSERERGGGRERIGRGGRERERKKDQGTRVNGLFKIFNLPSIRDGNMTRRCLSPEYSPSPQIQLSVFSMIACDLAPPPPPPLPCPSAAHLFFCVFFPFSL